ncbi:hypothetical protein VdG1_04978 [Verticillium dahliae VDG1]|nr:hypothetical protein VdG1_04978 [Verticillium dahliae VDG1]
MPPSAVNFDIHQGRQDFQRLDPDWRANIHESFNLIDTQDTGSLSAREWPIALNALGLQLPRSETTVCAEVNNMMTDQDLRKMIDTLDISGKGWVSKDEFMEMARGATKDRSH